MTFPRLRAFLQHHPRALKSLAITAAFLLSLALLLTSADLLLAGPVRARAERMMNAKLVGYTVHIGRARPHLWRLGLDLNQLVLIQNSHPDPPVADFAALEFSMQWRALLRFRVTGDLTLRRPALHINLAQIQEQARGQVSLQQRGWQSAVQAVFPIKLNQVRVLDGSLLYLADGAADKPLQLTRIYLTAANVRNSLVAPGDFPSPVTLRAQMFDTGQLAFTGAADFLRSPYAAARGALHLGKVPLDRLNQLASGYQLRTAGGFLSADGSLEYTPEAQRAHLSEVLCEDLQVDYVLRSATRSLAREHAQEALRLAKRVRNAPKLSLRVDRLALTRSRLGFLNETTATPYHLFLTDVEMSLNNLTNQADQGRSEGRVQGAFMGHGKVLISGGGRLTAAPADFAVRLKVDDARLPDLNPLFQAYQGVNVAAGRASVYAELTVQGGRVEGYVKPILRDVRLFDPARDRGKPLGKRVKMHVLQFLANLFRNHSTQDVATVARISGSTSAPRISGWGALGKFFVNGFIQGILPGFLDGAKRAPPPPAKAHR